MTTLSRIRVSLLAGALSDALGYPTEFPSVSAIRQRSGGIAALSGDTQITLFTAEDMLGACWDEAALPARWLEHLEAREIIEDMAHQLAEASL